ncbi:MAG TPA: MFS transporter [Chloroflexota bacterium]|nr:MFS transporter [Chloroflexota bacterium]
MQVASRLPSTWSWLPPETTSDASVIVVARGVRAFADGFVSVLLPVYLLDVGLDALQIGSVATATLVGSAALTLVVGLIAHRFPTRRLLISGALLMAATGAAFSLVHDYWPLMLVAFVGTLNPSSGDVSVFLPLEQAVLPRTVSARERTSLFARYSVVGSLLGALGALSAGVPYLIATRVGWPEMQLVRGMFGLYAVLALVAALLYRRLSPAMEDPRPTRAVLRDSRRLVYLLAVLFSLDAFGGGLIVQSLLAFWLFQRFDLSIVTAGTIFFWTGVLSAGSYLVAARLARRFGLVNTMVFSHLPSNVLLMLVPFMPDLPLAIVLLLARSLLSQMDVPARNSYVMAVVPAAERPAAASVTSVPRSLAAAAGPLVAGSLLAVSTFGWPLLLAGALKATYDLLLLGLCARVPPPEEIVERRPLGP